MKLLSTLSHLFKLLLLTSALIYTSSLAREKQGKPFEQYFLRIWQSEQGLPHNAGRSLVQTYDGYIWIGSQDGLVRYNGKEFYIFNKYNTPAIKHNDITALLETADSSLWIGTFNGLVQYKNGVFTYHPTNAGIEKEVIRALAKDHAGNIWIGTMNAGIHKYRNGRFEFFTTAQGLANNSINGIAEDYEGRLWVSTLTGINIYQDGNWLFQQYEHNVPNNMGQGLLVSRDSTVWIGTNSGLMRWKNNSFRTYTTADGLSDNVIRDIYQDKSGVIWIGTERGGICRFAHGVFSSFQASDGLTSNFVDAILEDREGNFWVGTYTEGIVQFIKSKFLNYSIKNGLPNSTIRTVMQSRDGIVWIGTEGDGVLRFDGKKFTTLSTKQGLPNNFIRSFFEDSHGTVWIGTRDGLARYHQGKIRVYSNRDGLAHTYIRSIAEDKNGNLWVGTVNGGVHRFVNGKFINYRSLGIPMNAIRSILVDHNNTIWVTGNEALVLWHDGKINTLTTNDGLPAEPIYSLYEDSAHVIWMGTNGGGLVRYKDGVITRYTYAEGLGDDVVYEILEDNQHNFWMSCNGGIYQVSKQQLTDYADGRIQRIRCTFYDASDGMISNEVSGNSQPAGWKTSDGRLWFPALKGVVIVDPQKLPENISPPPIVIERVLLNSIEKHMPQSGLVIPPGSGRAEFHFAALTYTSLKQVQYRIKLEGFDKEWVVIGSKNEATYTNLSPGKYVFHVTACNNDDIWNETGTSLAFELGQYFYQTVWFYGIVVIAFLTMAFGIYHWRVWRILKREQELKKRVDEAMSEIKILGGLIPICANCKKIRDDRGFWKQLETYIKEHSEASFTHGICPECTKKLYGNIISKK